MGLIKETDDFDMIVEHHIPSAFERRKICRYIDKLKKQEKLAKEHKKIRKTKKQLHYPSTAQYSTVSLA